jgi:hypothetical protein
MISVADIYNLRFGPKLALPKIIQENIAKLRISPAHYRPARPPPRHYKKQTASSDATNNWREKALADIVRRVREREDPEYSEVFAIFNKVAKSNIEKLSNDAIMLIQKRDDTFRLRVSTLLFDKAITNHSFASVMADCALNISKIIPEFIEDLQTQVTMFDTLYDMSDTITYSVNDVVRWTSQKEKRRGYAKFMCELNMRGIMPEIFVLKGLQDVVNELKVSATSPKSEQNDENIHQFAVFLFETAKLATPIVRSALKVCLTEFMKAGHAIPMKTKFKLEDALKLVS